LLYIYNYKFATSIEQKIICIKYAKYLHRNMQYMHLLKYAIELFS